MLEKASDWAVMGVLLPLFLLIALLEGVKKSGAWVLRQARRGSGDGPPAG
jgi:hypothetical protein